MIKGDIKPWFQRKRSAKPKPLTDLQKETYITVLSRLFLTRETHSNTVGRVLGIDGRKVQARLERLVKMGYLERVWKDGKVYYKNRIKNTIP
jgi:DNA-binding MarR family transcriptional regulator